MPDPCDCPTNKGIDTSNKPQSCSCPKDTVNSSEPAEKTQEQASSSNTASDEAPESTQNTSSPENEQELNISQSDHNKYETNVPSVIIDNTEDTKNFQPEILDNNIEVNVKDSQHLNGPWDQCKCNFPDISDTCYCSSKNKDDEVAESLNVAKEDNIQVDEYKDENTVGDIPTVSNKGSGQDEGVNSASENEEGIPHKVKLRYDAPTSTDLELQTTKDQNSLDNNKAADKPTNFPEVDISSGYNVSSKKVGDNSDHTENIEDTLPLEGKAAEDQSFPDENKTVTTAINIPKEDVPPDEGEIEKLASKGLDVSKLICKCNKDIQTLKSTNLKTNSANCERTFIMVKPDGVHRGLVGKIIKKFEQKGFRLVALTFILPSEELLKKQYADLADRPFFPSLIKYMSSGPVVPMVWEGLGIVSTGRSLLGATNPADSAAGTIRGDLCIQTGRNICHASDSVEAANNEIGLWFTEKEVISWIPATQCWVYED